LKIRRIEAPTLTIQQVVVVKVGVVFVDYRSSACFEVPLDFFFLPVGSRWKLILSFLPAISMLYFKTEIRLFKFHFYFFS
jgi:hypothetical protein